MTNSTK